MNNIFCPSCKKMVAPGPFCNNCGAPFHQPSTNPQADTPTQSQPSPQQPTWQQPYAQYQQPTKKPLSKGLKILGIGCAGLFVLFVILGIIGALLDKEKPDTKTNPPATSTPSNTSSESVSVPPPSSEPSPPQAQPENPQPSAISTSNLPGYTFLPEKVYDAPIKTQVELNLLVSGNITREGLTSLLSEQYAKAQARRGFKYREQPSHVFIYAYTSKEHAESGGGQWIAMLNKIGETGQPQINIKDNLLQQLGAKPEEQFGLSEDQSKQIFVEIILTERRATKEAEQKYPMTDAQQVKKMAAYESSLRERNKNDLAKRYKLTRKQLDEIGQEGVTKSWPYPRQ